MNGVLQTLHMTLLEDSYEVMNEAGPDVNGRYTRTVHFDAVRNADIPRTLPKPSNAPDVRLKELLTRLRALEASERARASTGQG